MPGYEKDDHDVRERRRDDDAWMLRDKGRQRSDDDMGRRGYREGDNHMGGWAGDGRTSDYESRNRRGDRDHDRHYGSDDFHSGLPMDETSRLIASNKVEGTAVYGRDGKKLGTIHNFMVDKRSGQVEYAVLKHGGGFLGLNESYCPLPWGMLTYDTREGGYHVDLTEYELEKRPNFDRNSQRMRRG